MGTEANIKTGVRRAARSGVKQIEGKDSLADDSKMSQGTFKPGSDNIFSYAAADNNNILEIIDIVRNGISYKDFSRIADDAPFSLTEWANYLQISERTIQRNQKEKKSFQPIQSERIVELSMLYQYGVDVFGDKDNFNTWLNSVSVALGGRTPKNLLDTKFGISMVKDELGRIEHGILA